MNDIVFALTGWVKYGFVWGCILWIALLVLIPFIGPEPALWLLTAMMFAGFISILIHMMIKDYEMSNKKIIKAAEEAYKKKKKRQSGKKISKDEWHKKHWTGD